MKQDKLIAKLLTLVMVISTVLQIFPIPTYAKEEAKIQAVSEYIKDKEVLEAKIDEALSTEDQMLMDVLVKKDTKDMILVFQKSLELTDNSLLPDGIEVDKDYKDTGIYGESYTSIRLKAKDKKEETKKETSDKSKLEISTSEEKIKTVKEKISLAFDVKGKLEKGDLFAVISDKYIFLVENKIEKDGISKESPVKEEEESFGRIADFLRSSQPVLDSSFFGKFTVKKKDENDKPLSKAEFTLSANQGGFSQKKESDNAGKIVFENLPPGEYTLKETKAPEGYELLKDCYKINVNKYGFTVATYVKVENPDGKAYSNPHSGTVETPKPQAQVQSRTSNVVDVISYNLTPIVARQARENLPTIWVTSGDFIRMKMTLKVKDGVKAGDSFTIKLDEKLSPTGLRERYIPPILLKINNQIVASGIYNEDTNSFVYTFTDYVERHTNVTISASYDTFGPETKKVLNSGPYSFTNIIDGKKQDEKKFYIDYGKSFEFAGGSNKGRKIRNNVASVDRHAGIVERVIYLNNGNGSEDVIRNTWSNQYLELLNNADSTVEKVEVFKVLSSQKNKYMPDSTPGITEGLEKLNPSVKNDDKKITFTFKADDYKDIETGKNSAGILIKVTEKLSSFRGASDMTATWGYNSLFSNSIGMTSSLVDSGAYSQGNSERFNPEISIRNKRIKTTDITVDKKWFTADGKEVERKEGSITYDLIQVATTKYGKTTEKVYKSGETLTSQEKWTKTYSGLQLQGNNDDGEEVTYTYYVSETALSDYDTSYSNDVGKEAKKASDTAISSGTITIKNTEKMKFVLPETGGSGRNGMYIVGAFMVGIVLVMLKRKRWIAKKD